MDRLNSDFTRTYGRVKRGDPFTSAAATQFQTDVQSVLNLMTGAPADARVRPDAIATNRLSKIKHGELAVWTQRLAWLLVYQAFPLIESAGVVFSSRTAATPTPPSSAIATATSTAAMTEELEDLRAQLTACKEELMDRHRKVSTLQDEVSALKDTIISMKDSQLERSVSAVQSVVQTEMKSYSSALQNECRAVKQSCVAALAPSKIRSAIAVAAEDRSSNLMVYGLPETADHRDEDRVKELMEHLSEAPVVTEVSRLGKRTEGRIRPVKLVLRSKDSARVVLSKAALLRDSALYSSVYIAPDRTQEERVERKELVGRLRERRELEPGKEWTIWRGSVVEKGSILIEK